MAAVTLAKVAAASLLGLLAGRAWGQYSSDPGVNLSVGDGGGDQVQPKVRPTADGGVYISWLDGGAGYDVRLQRLDVQGNEQWGHNGILIFNRQVSSTEDYDLVVDASGNAVIVYGDEGGTGGVLQVGINKVTPAGAKLFGASGVTVTSIATGVHSPHVAALSDGTYAVGWTGSNNWGQQRVSGAGALLLANPVITTELNGSGQALYISLADLQPSLNGTVIAEWIHGTTTSFITSTKHLYSQAYDGAAAPQWNGGSPVIVFNASSLQNSYFPPMAQDGSGGVVFSWYENGGSRNSYIQHASSAGALRFAAPVPTTGATPGFIRLGASAAYDAAADAYYIVSPQSNSNQSVFSVMVQKIDGTGTRQWGDAGLPLFTSGAGLQNSFATLTLRPGGGCFAFGFDQRSATTHVVYGYGLDAAGSQVFANFPCTLESTKGRLAAATSPAGFAVVVWHDNRGNGSDAMAQNVRPDGTLGNVACYANCDSSTIAPVLNVLDFNCFLNRFAAGDSYANCDNSNIPPVLNVLDFNCFLNRFAAGCP
jgi:hypothetical protein